MKKGKDKEMTERSEISASWRAYPFLSHKTHRITFLVCMKRTASLTWFSSRCRLPAVRIKIISYKHLDFSQKTGSENQLSSTSTSGAKGFPLNATEVIDDVTTTLLKDGTFAQDLKTFIVPFSAGSISCA